MIEKKQVLEQTDIFQLIRSFVPGYETEFFCIIVHALPKQVIYRIRSIGSILSSKERKFWDQFMETPFDSQLRLEL